MSELPEACNSEPAPEYRELEINHISLTTSSGEHISVIVYDDRVLRALDYIGFDYCPAFSTEFAKVVTFADLLASFRGSANAYKVGRFDNLYEVPDDITEAITTKIIEVLIRHEFVKPVSYIKQSFLGRQEVTDYIVYSPRVGVPRIPPVVPEIVDVVMTEDDAMFELLARYQSSEFPNDPELQTRVKDLLKVLVMCTYYFKTEDLFMVEEFERYGRTESWALFRDTFADFNHADVTGPTWLPDMWPTLVEEMTRGGIFKAYGAANLEAMMVDLIRGTDFNCEFTKLARRLSEAGIIISRMAASHDPAQE